MSRAHLPLGRFLDWLVPGAVALVVFSAALGSSSVVELTRVGSKLKWIALGLLLAVAVAEVIRNKAPRLPWLVYSAAAAVAGLAVVSSGWSVVPRHTFIHSVPFSVEIAGAVAVAQYAIAVRGGVERIVAALVAGAAAVTLAGLLLAAVSYDTAVQPGSAQLPDRFRGIGQNPNTVPLLLALALPLTAWILHRYWHALRVRAATVVTLVLMLVTVAWSGSRGALIAALVGTLVASFAPPRLRTRLVWMTAAMLLFTVSFVSRELGSSAIPQSIPKPLLAKPKPQPTPGSTTSPSSGNGGAGTPSTPEKPGPGKQPSSGNGGSGASSTPEKPGPGRQLSPEMLAGLAALAAQRQDEIGHPLLSKVGSAATGSGRVEAWKGAIRLANRRPLLGYGFATESTVFVDRYYFFQGTYVENSFIGLYLQLGALGVLVVFGGLGFLLLLVLARLLRRRVASSPLVFTFAGVAAAGISLATAQSFLYAPGNIGSSTFWLGVMLLAATVGTTRIARR